MNQHQQHTLDLSQAKDVKCDECKNEYFNEVLIIKKVSKLLTGTAKDQIVPISVLQCTKCNHVNKEFLPTIKK